MDDTPDFGYDLGHVTDPFAFVMFNPYHRTRSDPPPQRGQLHSDFEVALSYGEAAPKDELFTSGRKRRRYPIGRRPNRKEDDGCVAVPERRGKGKHECSKRK